VSFSFSLGSALRFPLFSVDIVFSPTAESTKGLFFFVFSLRAVRLVEKIQYRPALRPSFSYIILCFRNRLCEESNLEPHRVLFCLFVRFFSIPLFLQSIINKIIYEKGLAASVFFIFCTFFRNNRDQRYLQRSVRGSFCFSRTEDIERLVTVVPGEPVPGLFVFLFLFLCASTTRFYWAYFKTSEKEKGNE
jgi:hypothetical protein